MRENEASVLKSLQKQEGRASLDDLVRSTTQSDAAVTRAVTALQSQGLIQVTELEKTTLALTQEGIEYARDGMPERRLLQAVLELGGAAKLEQAAESAKITVQLATIALGWLKNLMKKEPLNSLRPKQRSPMINSHRSSSRALKLYERDGS